MKRSPGSAPQQRPGVQVAPSLASLRKQRAKKDSVGTFLPLGIGLFAIIIAVVMWSADKPPALDTHESYMEALRVLRNDGIEASDENVRFVLELIGAATKPFDDRSFRTVDSHDWPPQCHSMGRTCLERPAIKAVRRDGDGFNMSMLEIEQLKARVWLVEDFVSKEDAALLLAKVVDANFSFSPTNHATGQEWRSSSSAPMSTDDPIFYKVVQRAAALCGVPMNYVEQPQAVRYMPGERYQPHMDSEGPYHRHWTILLYLNDPGGGGATRFPLLRLKIAPTPRTALFWENLREERGLDQKVRNYHTLHDGQAPTGSEPKYALNIWVRNMVYVHD